MAGKWYVTTKDGTRYGPYDDEQFKDYAASGRVLPNDMVWQEGMPQWVPASSISSLSLAPPQMPSGPPPLPANDPSVKAASGNKIAAGICGILLGAFGIHKFILGLNTAGLVMLLVTVCTCGAGGIVMHIIGVIEGIIYLTRSDEEFYRLYVVEKKAWF